MKIAGQIKGALQQAIDNVAAQKECYVMNPKKDFSRARKMPMRDVINMIISMEGGSLGKELSHFSARKKLSLTASAFVQQRSKIKSEAFGAVFQSFNQLSRSADTKRFKGYKLLAADGSDINLPYNPQSETFLEQPDVKGFNLLHLNALYDICNNVYIDAILRSPRQANEQDALICMLRRLCFEEKTIIMTDRGYESYNTFAHFIEKENVDFLCRVKNGSGGIRAVYNLPMKPLDQDVAFEITTSQTKEDKANNRIFINVGSKRGKELSPKTRVGRWDFKSPYRMNFRVVRFLLDSGEYETVVTSLPRKKFSAQEIKDLYHMRWGIETSFRELKYAVGLVNLHCKKDDLLKQEIFAALIAFNFCSRIANQAVIKNRINAIYEYKVNLTMAIHLCRAFLKNGQRNINTLLLEIGRYTEPIRPGRQDVRKLRKKAFVGFVYRVAA